MNILDEAISRKNLSCIIQHLVTPYFRLERLSVIFILMIMAWYILLVDFVCLWVENTKSKIWWKIFTWVIVVLENVRVLIASDMTTRLRSYFWEILVILLVFRTRDYFDILFFILFYPFMLFFNFNSLYFI